MCGISNSRCDYNNIIKLNSYSMTVSLCCTFQNSKENILGTFQPLLHISLRTRAYFLVFSCIFSYENWSLV